MSIRTQYLLGVVGIMALLLVAGLVGVYQLETGMRAVIGQSSHALARSVVDQVERNVYSHVVMVREMTLTSPMILALAEESNLEFAASGTAEEIEAMIDERDAAWRASQGSPGGEVPEVLREVSEHPVSDLLRRKLEFFRDEAGYNVFGEIFLTHRYGVTVAQTGITSDYRQNDEPWWQAGRRDGVWLSEVAFDESSEVYSVDIAIGPEDASG